MNFTPKRPKAFKISKHNLDTSLKVPSFIYLRSLAEKLQRINMRLQQNFEGFTHPQMNGFEKEF